MIAINTWNKLREIIFNKGNIDENGAVCILFLNPNNTSETQQQIVKNIEYLHVRSGKNIDFFIPGFNNEDNEFLTDFKNRFDVRGFVDFIKEFERVSRWQYNAGTQLVILPYRNQEFNYSKVIDINLDKVKLYCNDHLIDEFFEELIRKFSTLNQNYYKNLLDISHRYALTNAGWEIVLEFVRRDITGLVSRFMNSREIIKLFKPKDLRKLPNKIGNSARQEYNIYK